MKKVLASLSGLGIWFVLGTQTFAMCIWFTPPGRNFEPATNIKTLVVQTDTDQTLVVQPQFQGDATDFALVMPFPSEPTVDEAPTRIFKQLEDLTNPVIERPIPVDTFALEDGFGGGTERRVEVIEERDVGDFTATTLLANDAEALKNWLDENGYELTDEKLDTLEHYIEESGYFVALKVNIASADVDSNGLLKGELKPISFTYSGEQVQLPLRLMADPDGDIFDLVVYTLSDSQLYIPGAEVQFARKITANDLDDAKALNTYDAKTKWLVRNAIQLDSTKIEKDLSFLISPADVVVNAGEQSVRINPELLDPKTGLIEADNGFVRYVEEGDTDDHMTGETASDDLTRPLIVITVLLGGANILLVNTVLKQRTIIGEQDE